MCSVIHVHGCQVIIPYKSCSCLAPVLLEKHPTCKLDMDRKNESRTLTSSRSCVKSMISVKRGVSLSHSLLVVT